MKTKSAKPSVQCTPSEQDISDYAFHLYEQGNREQGHDLDNWHEATACLKAGIPRTELV